MVSVISQRSESPWESVLRLLHCVADVEVEPQKKIYDDWGRFVARADLWVVGTRRLHEYDGEVHRDRETHRADLARERRLVEVDWQRIGFTSPQLVYEGRLNTRGPRSAATPHMGSAASGAMGGVASRFAPPTQRTCHGDASLAAVCINRTRRCCQIAEFHARRYVMCQHSVLGSARNSDDVQDDCRALGCFGTRSRVARDHVTNSGAVDAHRLHLGLEASLPHHLLRCRKCHPLHIGNRH